MNTFIEKNNIYMVISLEMGTFWSVLIRFDPRFPALHPQIKVNMWDMLKWATYTSSQSHKSQICAAVFLCIPVSFRQSAVIFITAIWSNEVSVCFWFSSRSFLKWRISILMLSYTWYFELDTVWPLFNMYIFEISVNFFNSFDLIFQRLDYSQSISYQYLDCNIALIVFNNFFSDIIHYERLYTLICLIVVGSNCTFWNFRHNISNFLCKINDKISTFDKF